LNASTETRLRQIIFPVRLKITCREEKRKRAREKQKTVGKVFFEREKDEWDKMVRNGIVLKNLVKGSATPSYFLGRRSSASSSLAQPGHPLKESILV